MRIEALEDIKSRGYTLTAGDIVQVPDEAGAHWCARGWAKDTSGLTLTGERRAFNAKLAIEPARHGHTAPKLEG